MRNDVRDSLIGSILLTIAIALPIYIISDDPIVNHGIYLLADLVILWYFGTRLAKAGAFDKTNQEINWKNVLILLPLCLAFLGLPISMALFPNDIIIFETDLWYFYILEALLTALIEEMFFRMIFYARIKTEKRILRILASAGIFALFEVITFLGNFSIIETLINMVSAFILGLFLGFIREYGESIYPCMAFHFLYLLFTDALGSFIGMDNMFAYYIIIVLPIIAILYLPVIYVFHFVKKEIN